MLASRPGLSQSPRNRPPPPPSNRYSRRTLDTSMSHRPLQHTSSSNHIPAAQEEEEPIYDVPPVEWTQTLPSRKSRRRITDPGDPKNAVEAAAACGTPNNRPLTLQLGHSAASNSTLNSQSTYVLSNSSTATGFDEMGSVRTLTRADTDSSSGHHNVSVDLDISLDKSSHKRSKSKSRSFVRRSGSVIKSIFGDKSKKDSSFSAESQLPQMQGRLLQRCVPASDLNAETDSWKPVNLSTVYNKLHAVVENGNELVWDLCGSSCEQVQLKGHKKKSVFKLVLPNDPVVRLFQADTKEAMNQWVDCIETLGAVTPVNGASVSPNSLGSEFIAPLETHTSSRFNPHIPLLVHICCSKIESCGMGTVGLYRVPGNNSAINELLSEITERGYEFSAHDERLDDVHTTASLLKTFFRKLPDPLINDDWYTSLIVANRKPDAQERLDQMRRVLHELPPHNFETLKYLAGHLQKVSNYSDHNKMDVTNLSIVFGPTLLRTSDGDMVAMWTDMVDQRCIIEVIINHHEWLFSPLANSSLPDVVRSADSQTSLSQIHKSSTSAVRKKSFDLNATSLPRNGSKNSQSTSGDTGSSPFRAPSVESYPASLSPKSAAVSALGSHSPTNSSESPGRISPSFARNFNPGIRVNIPAVPGAKSPALRSRAYTDAPQSHSTPERPPKVAHSLSTESSAPDMIDLDDDASRDRMLAELDLLIQSLKPDEKEVEEQRRSKEEGEQLFSEFCGIFPTDKETSSESTDSLDLIMLELDEKIASLRTEYTFKVDSLTTVDLEEAKDVDDVNFERADVSNSAMMSRATYVQNKAFGLTCEESSSVASSSSGSCDLRSKGSTPQSLKEESKPSSTLSQVPKFPTTSGTPASPPEVAPKPHNLSTNFSSPAPQRPYSGGSTPSKGKAPLAPLRKPQAESSPVRVDVRVNEHQNRDRTPSFYENLQKESENQSTVTNVQSTPNKTEATKSAASIHKGLFSLKKAPPPLPSSQPPPLNKRPCLHSTLPSHTKPHTRSGEDLSSIRSQQGLSRPPEPSHSQSDRGSESEAASRSSWVSRSNPDLLHDKSLQFNSATFFQSQV